MMDSRRSNERRLERLRSVVEHASHLLPKQGPIGVFVHHNTLHAFQHLRFEHAVIEASHLFGAEPYMSEAAYRAELARGTGILKTARLWGTGVSAVQRIKRELSTSEVLAKGRGA